MEDDDVEPGEGVEEPESPEAPSEPAKLAKPKEPQSFIDPGSLPEELKPHWKRMHSSYTKALEKTRSRAPDLELLDKYRSDNQFAVEVLKQEAARLGLTFTASPGGSTQTGQPAKPAGERPPAELVEAVRANLPAELQWMAESQAAAFWAANRLTLAPLLKEQQTTQRQQRETQYEELAAQLSERMPGWESHEEEMTELLGFLQSDRMTDRKWGSKLELLVRLVSSDGQAVAEAARRMGQAARSRTVTGQSGRSAIENVSERITKAKTDQEAWKIAGEAAVQELERHGIKVE